MDYNFIYNDLAKTNINNLTTAQIADMKEFILTTIQSVNTTLGYNAILNRMLSNAPDNLDKRTGSIIYDALAPSAGEMAQVYIQLQIWKDQTYLKTAIGEDLDRIGEQYGIPRLQATQAYRLGEFIDTSNNFVNMPINSRFSVPESSNTVTYYVKEYQSTGHPILVCEQEGTSGNDYYGDILPLFSIDTLKTATIIGTLQPAQNVEDDDTYRARIIERLNYKGFGGNVQDYIEYFEDEIQGTSKPQVYPVWNGGGTVKVSVMDSEYNPISDEFKAQIKAQIDPVEYEGQGIGIAPIGHTVTIDTPEKTEIHITATVGLNGVTIGQIEQSVKDNIEEYLLEVRKAWTANNNTNGIIISRIYISQISARILSIEGVENVTDITINGQEDDLELISTSETQYVPVLGEIELGGGN